MVTFGGLWGLLVLRIKDFSRLFFLFLRVRGVELLFSGFLLDFGAHKPISRVFHLKAKLK